VLSLKYKLSVGVVRALIILYFVVLTACAAYRYSMSSQDIEMLLILGGVALASIVVSSMRALAVAFVGLILCGTFLLNGTLFGSMSESVFHGVLLVGMPFVALGASRLGSKTRKNKAGGLWNDVTEDSFIQSGFSNVREFLKELDEEMARAKRHEFPLVLMIVELEYFDRILVQLEPQQIKHWFFMIEEVLKKSTRIEDKRYRIGDKTFAVIMPHTDRDGSEVVRERVRNGLHNIHTENDDHIENHRIDVRIGLMPYEPSIADSVEFKKRTEYSFSSEPEK